MSDKNKIIGIILAILLSFAVGRYSVTSNKTTDIVVNKDKKVEEDTHTKTIIVKEKDGREVTTIEQDTSTKSDTTTKSENKTVVASNSGKLNVSLLGGYDFKQKELNYGLSISKQFIGPVTLGAFGMNNGIVGVSVGIDF
jgi:hypothetical protein